MDTVWFNKLINIQWHKSIKNTQDWVEKVSSLKFSEWLADMPLNLRALKRCKKWVCPHCFDPFAWHQTCPEWCQLERGTKKLIREMFLLLVYGVDLTAEKKMHFCGNESHAPRTPKWSVDTRPVWNKSCYIPDMIKKCVFAPKKTL